MQGKALYRRSTFFVDVINVVLYIDLFLFYEVLERMKTDKTLKFFFEDNFPKIGDNDRHQQDVGLVGLFATKKHKNILEDWINKEKFLESNDEKMYQDYVQYLYEDMLANPVNEEYMQLTEFGSTLRLITKDKDIEKIIFYLPFESNPICSQLLDLFSGYHSDKMSVIIGDKSSVPLADTYVFEDIKDIDECIRVQHELLTEVVIPAYEYNLADDRDEEERKIEQATYRRTRLTENPTDYASKYNLSINTIGVPI